MTETTCPESLSNPFVENTFTFDDLVIPAGTYSLRRAHYLRNIEHEFLLSAEQGKTVWQKNYPFFANASVDGSPEPS